MWIVFQQPLLPFNTFEFGKNILQCSDPAAVLEKSLWWFNCHSWIAKSPVKGSVCWVVSISEAQAGGEERPLFGLPTPPACFQALWKWGHSKQTIHPDEWIMMHMFTEWDFFSAFSAHSEKGMTQIKAVILFGPHQRRNVFQLSDVSVWV